MDWNLQFCYDDFSCYYFDPILSAFLVGLIVYLVDLGRNRIKAKKKFGKISGNYFGYGYDLDSQTIKSDIQSEATVSYLKENLLKITVTEHPNKNRYKWEGIISLEVENYGFITWKYILFENEELKENKHKFGIKRIIVNNQNESLYLYLVEDDISNDGEFGREIFIRKN